MNNIFLDETSILSEYVSENHLLIPIINRFGIRLGLGDKSVQTICNEYNLNADFFLAVINTYLNEDYFPEKKLQSFDINLIADYLHRTDSYYVNAQLTNIEKHLNAFVSISDPTNKQLVLIKPLFYKFKEELLGRISRGLLGDDEALALLMDIKNILIKHISGNFNENLCYAVIFSVGSMLTDLEKHNRIRNKILKPMVAELNEAGIDDWENLLPQKDDLHSQKSDELSHREIEVLTLIAQGLLNKEVADKLNISLNTVLSHRKNITAKLGVKTVSGLIFYCISHGLITSDEIEQ